MARPRSISDAALLDAARAVFTERGAEASTRQVAEAAGVSQTVLFQRFRTKQALFFAAMLPRPMDVGAILGELPECGAREARLHLIEVARRLSRAIQAALPGTLRGALHPAYPQAVAAAHLTDAGENFVDALAERLRDLQARGDLNCSVDPATVAETMAEMLHGNALAVVLGAASPSPDAAERAVDLLWQGLAPQGEAR